MKKIYILTAVFALLTLSLNAQMLPEFQRFKADKNLNPTQVTQVQNGQLNLASPTASSNQGMNMRAPMKALNQGEYYLGPYTTDDFNTTGLGFGDQYNAAQSIDLNVVLNRSEFEDHIGDEIVGFRFALAGSGVVPVWSFGAFPCTFSETSISWDSNQYNWDLGSMHGDGYVKVTSLDELTDDGEYLIVYEGSSYAFDGSLTTLDANNNYISVSINNGVIEANSTVNASKFYIERVTYNSTTYFVISNTNGTYIGYTGSTNGAMSTGTNLTTTYLNTITFNNGNAVISGYRTSNPRQLRFYNNRFRYYSSTTGQNIQIYKRIGSDVVFLNGGQWYEYRLDEPVVFNVSDGMDKLMIGYIYYQPLSSNTTYNTTPIAYNPNSTGHDHYALMYADASSTSTPNYQRSWWGWNFPGDLAVQLIFKSTAPKLIAPTDGSTVNVGTNEGSGVSTTIPVSGHNLTGDLTVSVSGTGFSVSPTTISAADANAGTSVTVTYNGTDPNATGTLTITSSNGEVSTVNVNLTASYVAPVPELTAPTDGTTVNVGTNTGAGVSTTITVSGLNLTSDLTVSVEGTGFTIDPTTITAADANAGTATITITYNGYNANATGTLTITSGNGEVEPVTVNLTASFTPQPIEPVTGLLRLHLLLVDQLKANIPDDNSHADSYRYVLKYEPTGGETKESSPVKVDIHKTECEVKGYYTKEEIDGDTDGALTMDVLTADVEFNLTDDDNTIDFYNLQGKPNEYPALGKDYLTKLQQTTGFVYYEMLDGSPNKGDDYPAGLHHYYDDSTPILTGTYTDGFMSYAPSLSTWGVARRYFEDDGLDNTYGAPIWRTRVGEVQIQGKPAMQKQVINAGTPQEAPNPWTSWTEGGKDYSLFFLGVNAQAKLPNIEGTYGTNIKYEPYMFRVFVASPTGKLRKYTKTLGEGGGYSLTDGGPIAANEKYCVGSFLVNDGWQANDLFFSKTINSAMSFRSGDGINSDAWDSIMKFAAEDGIKASDVKVYVRFYYMVEGWNATRGESRPGNGAEGSGDPDDPSTYVYEYNVNAEVVGVTYVNAQGMQSDKPFDGLNIVVTRYSDGTMSTSKVMR